MLKRIAAALRRRSLRAAHATAFTVRHALRRPAWRRRLASGRFRIGIQTLVINTYQQVVWGDECMARGLAQAFRRLGYEVEVVSTETHDIAELGLDVMIAMYPTGEIPGFPQKITLPPNCLNLYWAQVPQHHLLAARDPRFAGFMFASLAEMDASSATQKIWLPMSADAEAYRPVDTPEIHDVVLCANNIKGRSAATLEKYLSPLLAIPGLRLSIRGSWWEDTPYRAHCHGQINPADVPALYSSARVILSIHGDSHFAADMPTSRLFEAAACGRPILSDELPTAKKIFGDSVCWTAGGSDTIAKLTALLADDERRRTMAASAREIFLRSCSFDAQAQRVQPFLTALIAGKS